VFGYERTAPAGAGDDESGQVAEDAALSEDEADDNGDDMGADKMIQKAKASAKGMDRRWTRAELHGMVPTLIRL
jgi:hypothetical protein